MRPVHSTRRGSGLAGVAFSFSESMSGDIGIGGMAATHLQVRVRTADLGRFLRDPQHRAEMEGTVSVPSLGGTFEIRDGRFELFSVDPQTGMRRLVYAFHFRASDGQTYAFRGWKRISHRPWRFDVLEDLTHLFTSIHRGMDETAPLYGTGVLRSRLADVPALIASMRCEGAFSCAREIAARAALLSVCWGALRNEYLRGIRLFYESQYENLVLAGRLENQHAGAGAPFFFVSGVHDKGFPWGDGELFSDVLLAVADRGGGYRWYGITDRTLPGLRLDVAAGTYRYQGPISAIDEGRGSSWSRMKSRSDDPGRLRAEIEVAFEPQASDIVSFPFPTRRPPLRGLSSRLIGWLWRTLPGTNPPGIHIRFQAAVVRSGFVRIRRASDGESVEELSMDAGCTSGECEHGTFRSFKRPRLRYEYRCTVDPGRQTAHVRIVAGAFGADRPVGRLLGAFAARIGSAEIRTGGAAGLQVTKIGPRRRDSGASRQDAPLLELSNDHYPTAALQRRIVEVEESGERLLALEEGASGLRPGSVPPASPRPLGPRRNPGPPARAALPSG